MKSRLFLTAIFFMAVLCVSVAPATAKPATFNVQYNQAQFQWRCFFGAFEDGWNYLYENSPESSDYRLTGNVLQTEWTYSPVVTDLEGQSTVYVYNGSCWIEHEGQVNYKYVAGYGDYWIVNFFRGYVAFEGEPSADSFTHGVAYQWVYLYAPFSETPPVSNAVWDETIGAWLVGFSIYLWDDGAQNYKPELGDIGDPVLFIEPVPASNCNPLGL